MLGSKQRYEQKKENKQWQNSKLKQKWDQKSRKYEKSLKNMSQKATALGMISQKIASMFIINGIDKHKVLIKIAIKTRLFSYFNC